MSQLAVELGKDGKAVMTQPYLPLGIQDLQHNYITFFLLFIAKGVSERPALHFELFTSISKVDFTGLDLLQELF